MKIKFKFSPIAAATAVVIAASVLVACGGGNDSTITATTTAVPIAGAGNNPFVGVTMKAECSNGTSGTGVIGTNAAPGDGVINVAGTCTPPIKITAISMGKMRPLGAKADGTEDVTYSPDVNLPVSNILPALPTSTAPGTANPVTTLVANQVLAANPTLDVDATTKAVTGLATAQGAVALSLGITSTDGDYRSPEIAAASTRIAAVAALAIKQAAAATTLPPEVTGTKTLGQFVAEQLGKNANAADEMNSAANIAKKLISPDPVPPLMSRHNPR